MKLISAGLVREMKAKGGTPAGVAMGKRTILSLKLTAAGAKAIAVDPEETRRRTDDEELEIRSVDQSPDLELTRLEPLLPRLPCRAPPIAAASPRGSGRSWQRAIEMLRQTKARRSPSWQGRWTGCRIQPARS